MTIFTHLVSGIFGGIFGFTVACVFAISSRESQREMFDDIPDFRKDEVKRE